MDALIKLYTPARLARLRPPGNPSRRPIFIVGMPRSGTTLVEQILSRHSGTPAGGEVSTINALARKIYSGVETVGLYSPAILALTTDRIAALSSQYLDDMAQIEAEKARITDQMPHNFQHVGFILALFPNARVIFCKRNALDNCTWIFTSPLNEEHAYKNTLEDLGRYYLAHNRLRQHWLQMDPERVFDLQYEPLITDFEPTVRKLFAFIDMPFEDGTLDFYRSGRVVNTISRNQVTKPLYSSAMGRWRAFEAELAPLRAIVGDD